MSKSLTIKIFAPFKKLGHALARIVFSPRKSSLPFSVSKGTRILFLRHDALGDMISTLPMLRMVKQHIPHAELHVLCTKANMEIIEHCDFIDHIHVAERSITDSPYLHIGLIRKIRSMNVDIIVNCLTSKASKNGVLTSLLSGKNTLSCSVFSGEQYELYYSSQSHQAANMKTMWEKMLMLGAETFGIAPLEQDKRPILPSLPEHADNAKKTLQELGLQSGKFIAINLSVGQDRNRWDEQAYSKLISYLLSMGEKPLLFGMSADAPFIEQLEKQFPDLHHYPFGRHILEIGEALRYAAWGISPDTGFLHLASAAQCPIVGLYGYLPEVAKDEWIPYGIPHRRVFSSTQAVRDISVKDVIQACNELTEMLRS